MNERRLAKGAAVRFSFTLDPVVGGTPAQRLRTGTGTVASDDVNYRCWPPGYTVRVDDSPHYSPGTLIAVCSHNLYRGDKQ